MMTMSRTIALHDFLTEQQIRKCISLWKSDREHFHKRVLVEVIEPNMNEINRKLGQANDARYIAYALEYVMLAQGGGGA